MSTTEPIIEPALDTNEGQPVDTKLAVVVIPISGIARAKGFHEQLGWRRI